MGSCLSLWHHNQQTATLFLYQLPHLKNWDFAIDNGWQVWVARADTVADIGKVKTPADRDLVPIGFGLPKDKYTVHTSNLAASTVEELIWTTLGFSLVRFYRPVHYKNNTTLTPQVCACMRLCVCSLCHRQPLKVYSTISTFLPLFHSPSENRMKR